MNFGLLILPFNKEFSFVCFHGFLQKVMPRMLKMRTRRKQVEAAGSARQIKKLGAE